MSAALNTLEAEFSENENRLTVIAEEIDKLMMQAEMIKKNNEHLAYSIAIIKTPPSGRFKRVVIDMSTPPSDDAPLEEKKTLRSAVLDVIEDGESIAVGDAWDRVTKKGFTATRAVINSTLHNLVKRGDLVQPEVGLYQKAE